MRTTLPLTLETRVGRRIALLFVLSALVPIVVLAVLGYRQVRGQLLVEADTQLRQAAKSVGMGLLDQLHSAADELNGVAAAADGRADAGALLAAAPARTREVFSALVWGAAGAAAGEGPDSVTLSPNGLAALRAGRAALAVSGHDSGTVWLVAQPARAGRALWGAVRPAYLFAGAAERSVVGAGDADFCVYAAEPAVQVLHCQRAAPAEALSASWSVFLGFDYGAPSWRVEVHRASSAVLRPIAAFRRTFFASLVAVLGLVVALTAVQVRRSLQPLEALKAGTERLARRDFTGTVSVTSGDEFEELAASFNGMAGELDQKFRDNAQLIARLNDLTYGALAALARTIDASSPWTAGHSERVTAFSMRMAARLELGGAQRDALRRGGLLHDIGKIGISPLILDKPGALDPDELARIREHPALGAKILAPLAAFADALPVVRSHHERWDGRGYPDRLAGEDIPMLARLLAVADVYDALVSSRPYRAGWPQAHALETIRGGAGSHFDPEMVRVFMDVMREEGDAARFRSSLEAVA